MLDKFAADAGFDPVKEAHKWSDFSYQDILAVLVCNKKNGSLDVPGVRSSGMIDIGAPSQLASVNGRPPVWRMPPSCRWLLWRPSGILGVPSTLRSLQVLICCTYFCNLTATQTLGKFKNRPKPLA